MLFRHRCLTFPGSRFAGRRYGTAAGKGKCGQPVDTARYLNNATTCKTNFSLMKRFSAPSWAQILMRGVTQFRVIVIARLAHFYRVRAVFARVRQGPVMTRVFSAEYSIHRLCSARDLCIMRLETNSEILLDNLMDEGYRIDPGSVCTCRMEAPQETIYLALGLSSRGVTNE